MLYLHQKQYITLTVIFLKITTQINIFKCFQQRVFSRYNMKKHSAMLFLKWDNYNHIVIDNLVLRSFLKMILYRQKLEINLLWKLFLLHSYDVRTWGFERKSWIAINLWDLSALQRPHPVPLTVQNAFPGHLHCICIYFNLLWCVSAEWGP